jgi:WD40 repeat protein
MMRHPYFECVFTLSPTTKAWLSAMVVSPVGVWTCVLGDSDGSLEVYRKGSPRENDIESKVASFTGALVRHKRWDKIHLLGIIGMVLANDEKFVITISSDGTAKIVDFLLGAIFFSVDNPRKCMYTGVLWNQSKLQFYLGDELGTMELWSLLLERKINDSCDLVPLVDKETATAIISTHRDPLVADLTAYKVSDSLVTLLPRAGLINIWKVRAITLHRFKLS